ncbi:class II histocompatibility antigen, M alpha chain [Pelecanus crispus]|uniref:class II histocompatibility antigen, M alpha chain n=1 Tax=Pelecanus crispus TaxID=36300 RepID=UPI003F5D338D
MQWIQCMQQVQRMQWLQVHAVDPSACSGSKCTQQLQRTQRVQCMQRVQCLQQVQRRQWIQCTQQLQNMHPRPLPTVRALVPARTPACTPALPAEPPAHTLAEVLFCQPAMPSLGLALAFDADQLFWFDFPGSRWTPRLPDLPPWPPAVEPPTQLLHDATLCQNLRRSLTALATGMLPESKGIPQADVFPVQPPVLGEPNTLVCMVGNIFPPAVAIGWQLNGVPVTQGVTHTHYTATADLTFVRFSYLLMTPADGDIYTCIITREGDNSSIIAYWVPQYSAPSEVLETALCGAAMALGILLALLGIAMILVTRRNAHG